MKILRISENTTEFSLPKAVTQANKINFLSCNCFTMFHTILKRTFYKVGYVVGHFPSYFIIIPFFLSILGLTGFQKIQFEKDVDYLFIPTDADSKITRDFIENTLPFNTSYLFDISRISRAKNFAKIYITAKDGGTMFRTKIWKDVVLLDELIQNMTIVWKGKDFAYKDICASWFGECFENNIYNLNEIIGDVEKNKTWISYPIMLFPFVLPMFYGGTEINEDDGVMLSAKALFATYWVRQDNPEQNERAHIWEGSLLNLMADTDFETIHVDRFVSRSVPDEIEMNNNELRAYLPFVLLLLVGFSISSLLSYDWVRSKIQMGLLGVFTVILSIFSSFGLLMYLGVPFIGINTAAPFLILGIGLDDMFVILSAWRKTKLQDPIPNRLALTFSSTAVSITVTSLTNMCAFFIGTFTTFPGVRIFCLYVGVSILFTYLWFITFFGACLATFGYQEKQQRHSLLCCKIKPKSESGSSCWLYRLFCSGGINRKDPWNPIDNKPCSFSVFFKNYFAPCLNTKAAKIAILVAYLLYLALSIFGCLQVKVGLDPKNFAVDGSYLETFFDVENTYFRKFPYRIQVIIKGNVTYHDKDTKADLLKFHRSLEDLSYVGPRLYTRSWIRSYIGFLGRRQHLLENITNEESFIKILQNDFMEPMMKETTDVAYSDDGKRILATRFIIQGYEIKDIEEDKKMIQALRKVCDDSPFDASIYHPTFVYYDQSNVVCRTLTKSIIIAAFVMMAISLVFIPNPMSAVWVGFSILSIEIGVVGFMSLWNVRIDVISMINLILSIGFSVDFSSHIVYSYSTSTISNPSERVKDALFSMGFPIVQCSMTTILGVVLFTLVPSYMYRSFFKVIFLVTFFGTLHALFVLPTLLSLTSKISCKVENSENSRGKKRESRTCFTNCPSDIIKDEDICGVAKKESCFESTSISRLSSLSGSKSIQSESLSSSQSSSGPSSGTDFEKEKPEVSNIKNEVIEVEHL